MIYLKSCPVCNGGNFTQDLSCKDYTVSNETFQIVQCSTCQFKVTNPRPEEDIIGNYYKSEEYISHSDTKKGIISKLYHLVRNYTLNQKLKLVSRHVSRGTILDYGCGTGMFLNLCKDQGWDTIGIEPDPSARKIAEKNGERPLRNVEDLMAQNPNIKFGAITLWHVLEHITDLDSTLKFFKKTLDRDGVLIVAVPNYTSYDAKHYKEFWAAYDVPRHLYHFEINSITRLMNKEGFRLVETMPMRFDSFYVSLLSEKYRTGVINYLRAFFIGLTSNIMAKTATQYSSVIYVFKHNN